MKHKITMFGFVTIAALFAVAVGAQAAIPDRCNIFLVKEGNVELLSKLRSALQDKSYNPIMLSASESKLRDAAIAQHGSYLEYTICGSKHATASECYGEVKLSETLNGDLQTVYTNHAFSKRVIALFGPPCGRVITELLKDLPECGE